MRCEIFGVISSVCPRATLTVGDGTYLGRFDVDIYLLARNARVLVFPPVSNFRRFLIHKLVEESFPLLKTFSVGEADARRTVICFQADYQPENAAGSTPGTEVRQPSKRPRTMPSVGIYRPPAARKQEQNATDLVVQSTRRKSNENSLKPTTSPPSMPNEQFVDQEGIKASEKRGRPRRPDMAVYVPRGQRIAQEHQRKLEAISMGSDGVELQLGAPPFEDLDNSDSEKQQRLSIVITDERAQLTTTDNSRIKAEEQLLARHASSNVIIDTKNFKNQNEIVRSEPENVVTLETIERANDSDSSSGTSSISIEYLSCSSKEDQVSSSAFDVPKGKAPNVSTDSSKSKEMLIVTSLEDNGCKFKENLVPERNNPELGILELQKKVNLESPRKIEKTATKCSSNKKEVKLNPEELDWDVLYDDSGECLEPSLLGQLTSAVGQVAIETPKTSYGDYKHRNLEDEFPHVVEIYNFPPEFKTPDLVMVFSDFKNSGFEIKWVDDTHALGVFSNAAIVSEVLCMQHPFVKTRCLSEGSQQSKSKARRIGDSLTPYTPRPDTCAALARRLVTGALGVKLPTQRAEREAERKLLREAREKKRLAAKQREEAWEGTFS